MAYLISLIEALISYFHLSLNHWGWSIFALALTIRLLMFPIQLFSFKQQRLMAKIQPELDRLSALYKEDSLKLFKEVGELKKREGVRARSIIYSSRSYGFDGFSSAKDKSSSANARECTHGDRDEVSTGCKYVCDGEFALGISCLLCCQWFGAIGRGLCDSENDGVGAGNARNASDW